MRTAARPGTGTTSAVRAGLGGGAAAATISAPGDAGDALLIIGSPERAARLCEEIAAGYGVTASGNGHAAPGNGHDAPGNGNGATDRRFLDAEGLKRVLLEGRVSEVIVDAGVEADEELAEALIASRFRGVRVRDSVDFFEEVEHKVWLEAVSDQWLLHSDGFNHSRTYRLLKRVLDVTCAIAFLLITAPLLAAIAIAIKLDSRGPLLFKQERVGLDRKSFMLYKFRSMREDAEKETGPVWAGVDDDRATRVGAVLRRLHLDEFPQVINVLRNELSFVGPRPERPCFVEILRERVPYYDFRHFMKPGITGWAQVNYPYADCIEDGYKKLEYDLYYAKHASIALDLWVMLRTVKSVIFAEGR